jgi:DNA repair protein SbcC/Rad50
VLIKRLYLRNFRVYEDELDLELPPGLVGIYGPNGAGKSTLLEAILFTLWGKARTTRDQIRSAGVGGECVTEVEFEHEGHLYLVRRTLRGLNSQVSVEAHCDGALMSTGTRDAERFVESVLGMDDAAFRASVFTEQKQLAAFSNQSPADRRRLVLQLLGITPLDAARDAARKDARELTSDHDRLRGMLADLEVLETEAADSQARAAAARVTAAEEAVAAAAARDRSGAAVAAFHREDQRRQEYDSLVVEGRAARQELDAATAEVETRSRELQQLDALVAELADLDRAAADLNQAETLLEMVTMAAAARRVTEQLASGERPPEPDETAARAATEQAVGCRSEAAAAAALLDAARTAAETAQRAASKSAALSGDAECPTCGQALGPAFETVQAHRRAELAEARRKVTELEERAGRLATQSDQSDASARRLAKELDRARQAFADWQQIDRRRTEAEAEWDGAWSRALTAAAGRLQTGAGLLLATPDSVGGRPGAAELSAAADQIRAEVQAQRQAAGRAAGIRARLEARPGLASTLAAGQERMDAAASRVEVLRDKVRALDFRRDALEAAASARDAAVGAEQAAGAQAHQAAVEAATEEERAAAARARLADGRAQHAQLADLETEARHRARAADLLSEFRNTVVASVGPRLAVQAADLFGELTDHEYEKIDVDPDTYQLQIGDGGRLYGLDRFSGSEIDLANLALRVAISEHIHFQSGGSVGLLVLDEVFGPLDDDRKARMLLALERLKGRFRQVLVVTHDTEIKDQLPTAIEVLKRPGRRATARVLGD